MSRSPILSMCYTSDLKVQTRADFEFLPIIPIDDDTRAMLAYAASSAGRAHIEQARQELQEGNGIIVTPGYFDEMKRRIANRRKGARAIDA
jgi:hypothetical protein